MALYKLCIIIIIIIINAHLDDVSLVYENDCTLMQQLLFIILNKNFLRELTPLRPYESCCLDKS